MSEEPKPIGNWFEAKNNNEYIGTASPIALDLMKRMFSVVIEYYKENLGRKPTFDEIRYLMTGAIYLLGNKKSEVKYMFEKEGQYYVEVDNEELPLDIVH